MEVDVIVLNSNNKFSLNTRFKSKSYPSFQMAPSNYIEAETATINKNTKISSYTILPTDDDEETTTDNGSEEENHRILTPSSILSDVSSDDIKVVVPPDGGWGWMIVFASFMCNVIVDGIICSYGMFLESIVDEFKVSSISAALVGSLMSGFYLIVGPFASAIANKFGFRLVAIIGSILGAFALAISSFSTSVEFLYISYGLIGGIGFGFIYVPAVITVGFYFEKWRALATGIGVCGSGIGTFLFAPLSKFLINSMGWRNALLVQAAIVLSCFLFGILYRPLKPTKLKDLESCDDAEIIPVKPELLIDDNDEVELPRKTVEKMEEALKQLGSIKMPNRRRSLSKIYQLNNSDHLHLSDVYHTFHHIPAKNPSNFLPIRSYFKEKRSSVPSVLGDIVVIPKLILNAERTHAEELINNRPFYREDIFFQQSLTRLPQYKSQSSIAYNLKVTRLPTKEDILEEKSHSCKLYPEAVKRVILNMLDFSLLKSPSFLILAIGGFFTMMGFYVPFVFLTERAKASGHMPEDAAVFLISAVGIANTLGRVLCGVLSSFPSVNALFVNNVALTIGGVATLLSGISLTQQYQFFYTVVFGLAISCFASLRSIIVVDLLGLERLTNAFGLLLLFQGIAAMIGAPLAGAFLSATGSFDAAFYLAGSMILISAIMCYPLNWVNNWETRRNQKNRIDSI